MLRTFAVHFCLSLVGCAALSLVGCATWDNAPDGATGFLVVQHESLEGTVDGVAIDGSSVRGSGYCTAAGWHLELRARAGDRDILNTLEVRDLLVVGRDAVVTFEPAMETPNELRVSDGIEPGRMSLESCAGDLSSPEFVSYASGVSLSLAPRDNGDIAVEYVATFETGDTVRGQFDMEMPVVD